MAFKSVEDYNSDRYNGMFILQNDGDYADVIFMYRSKKDVLVADTHYIKSADYSGYVHCCGRGCPACAKGIRVQTKLFIPMYVINQNRILFFDRSIRFDAQLEQDVFSRYPNPSEFVFRITRRGASGDVNTRYEIQAVGRNTILSYNEILLNLGVTMPDYYSTVCREYSSGELTTLLSSSYAPASGSSYNSEMPDYQVSPRVKYSEPPASDISEVPFTESNIPEGIDEFAGSVIDEEIDPDVNF